MTYATTSATTDVKHKLIVNFEVTNQANDAGTLHAMSKNAKEVMGVETLTNLADKGVLCWRGYCGL